MNRWLALAGWLVLVFSATLTAVFVSTGGWYEALNKPSWNPPGWLFGPVWSALYLMMAVAAWRVWCRGGWPVQGRVLGLFLAQWLLNALWTPIFFGLKQPGWAFAEILILLVLIVLTIRAFARVDKPASYLLFPYMLWVAFASVLNLTIWMMNR